MSVHRPKPARRRNLHSRPLPPSSPCFLLPLPPAAPRPFPLSTRSHCSAASSSSSFPSWASLSLLPAPSTPPSFARYRHGGHPPRSGRSVSAPPRAARSSARMSAFPPRPCVSTRRIGWVPPPRLRTAFLSASPARKRLLWQHSLFLNSIPAQPAPPARLAGPSRRCSLSRPRSVPHPRGCGPSLGPVCPTPLQPFSPAGPLPPPCHARGSRPLSQAALTSRLQGCRSSEPWRPRSAAPGPAAPAWRP